MITLAMLIGIIIGYITGNIVPLQKMNILFLQGPNLNLLGIKSVNTKSKLTLDKLNKAVKKESKKLDINLKTLQTHKEFQAINFLQRNRNWADGLIFYTYILGKK